MKYKQEMLKNLRAYIREKKPDMSMGIEWVSDPTSMYADYIHSVAPNLHVSRKDKFGVPCTPHAPMYQYTFPEVYVTNRDIYNNDNVAPRCNLTVMRGWRDDAGVYRCRATVDDAPVYKAYLAKIAPLREKYRDLILNGTFRDRDLATCDSHLPRFHTFENGSKMAIVTTSLDDAQKVSANFTATGYKFLEGDGIGDFKIRGDGEKANVELGKNALAVVVFEKK